MIVLKAKLEISCSSTTFIKEVFAVDEWIRTYSIVNLHCHSKMAMSEHGSAHCVVVDQPQAVATVWWQHASVGLAGQARAHT